MATIKAETTLNEVLILEVAGDPSITLGTPAPLGSIALDDTGFLWSKSGTLDTNWTKLGSTGGGSTSTLPLTTIIATTYSISTTDYTIVADTTSNSITLTLPTAVGATGKIYNIKRSIQNTNTLILNTTSSQTSPV